MNTLFLHLPVQGHECHAWLSSAGGLEDLGRDTPDHFAHRYPGAACVVFLPSSQCLFTTVAISPKQLRQATQSLGWLIEEQVGDDVENLQVIAGASQDAGATPLIAIAKTTLQEHLLALRAAGLAVIALLPDQVLVPADESEWQLVAWDNALIALRTGPLGGAVLEAGLMELMLDAALQERDALVPLTISAALPDAASRAQVQAWADRHSLVECHFVEGLGITSVLATSTDWSKHPANFLQGNFSTTQGFSLPSTLRLAAVFVAVAFSVQLLSEWVYYGYYKYQADKVGEAAVVRYKSTYTQERLSATKALPEVQKRMKGHSNETRSDGSVLPLLTRVAESLQGSGLDTQRVDFSGGVITLDVDARALGDLDGFKQKLEGQGFHAEIVSANSQGSVIRGRLRVEGGA